MTVYVDDAGIPAEVRNGRVHRSRWSHLTAGTQDELHALAGRLGLRREWFQPGRPRSEGTPSPFWHYDVTAGKRALAIAMGARPTPWREMPAICRARDAAAAGIGQRQARSEPVPRRHGRYYPPGMELPEGICPDSRSSALISGREKCQSCGVLEAMAVAQPRAVAYADLSHGQPGHICALPGAGRNTEAGQ
jgi:hypothetical protein